MARSIEQVFQSAQRMHHATRFHEYDIGKLRQQWSNLEQSAGEFADFVPIRLVTIIESQIRAVLAQAIDADENCEQRSIKLFEGWKPKAIFEALIAVSRKRITIGQIAAHSITIGSYSDMIATLEKVLGQDIEDSLKSVTTCWIEDVEINKPPVIENYSENCKILKNLFHVRHVLVHEMPDEKPYDAEQIVKFLDSSYEIVCALSWLFAFRSGTLLPMTQTQMNISAWSEAKALEDQLNEARGITKEKALCQEQLSDQIEYHWDQFASLSAQAAAKEFEGGSMAPMVQATEYADLLRWRLERLIRRPHAE